MLGGGVLQRRPQRRLAAGTQRASAANGGNVVLAQVNDHTAVTSVNYLGPTTVLSVNIQFGEQTAANDGILNTTFDN